MNLDGGQLCISHVHYTSRPNPTTARPTPSTPSFLDDLEGTWTGPGFNQIFLPDPKGLNQGRLQLNKTTEQFEFTRLDEEVPNRGWLQGDIQLDGVRYIQTVADASTGLGLHVEPGFIMTVPATTAPASEATVVRLASIPHGTTIRMVGSNLGTFPVAPQIEDASIDPTTLDGATLRDAIPPAAVPGGLNPEARTNPNVLLKDANKGRDIKSTTVLEFRQEGSGISNIPFLGPPGGNAGVVSVSSTFWINRVALPAGGEQLELQYTQTVVLRFAGLDWPHISVATLVKQK